VYVPVLFALTHWPNLTLPLPGRPDLIVHMGVFGLWTVLVIGSGFFGPARSARNIAIAGAIAALYSGVDELLQAVPFLHRWAAWDDWLANLAGVGAAILFAVAIAAALGAVNRRPYPQAPPSPGGSPAQR
jgi:VanZ family protein